MIETMLFCVPGDAYRNKSDKEVSEEYYKMAIKGFDKLIQFSPEYEPFKEKPNYIQAIGKKNNKTLEMLLFINQQLKWKI